MDLENSRDDLLFELHKLPRQNPNDTKMLTDYFANVHKLSEDLGKLLSKNSLALMYKIKSFFCMYNFALLCWWCRLLGYVLLITCETCNFSVSSVLNNTDVLYAIQCKLKGVLAWFVNNARLYIYMLKFSKHCIYVFSSLVASYMETNNLRFYKKSFTT